MTLPDGGLIRLALASQWRQLRAAPSLSVLMLLGIALAVMLVVGVELSVGAARAGFEAGWRQLQGPFSHQITAPYQALRDGDYQSLRGAWRAGDYPVIKAMAPRVQGVIRVALAPGSENSPVESSVASIEVLGVDVFAGLSRRGWTADAGGPDAPPGPDAGNDPDLAILIVGRDTLVAVQEQLGKPTAETVATNARLRVWQQRPAGWQPIELVAAAGAAGSLAVADIAVAQWLLDKNGQLDAIDLKLACGEGTDADHPWRWLTQSARSARANVAECGTSLRAQLAGQLVLESHAQTREFESGLADAFYFNLRVLGLLAAVVAVFLVRQVVAFALARRITDLGRLRALGVTRAELWLAYTVEVGTIAMVAGGLGCVAGLWLAGKLVGSVGGAVNDLFHRVSTGAIAADGALVTTAIGLALVVALLALAVPLHRLNRQPVVALLRGDVNERASRVPWRWIVLTAVLGGLGLVVTSALFGALLAVAAVLLVGALLLPHVLPATGMPWPFARSQGALLVVAVAVRDLGRTARDAGLACGALMIAVAAALGMTVMIGSLERALNEVLDQRLAAPLAVAHADGLEVALLDRIVAQVCAKDPDCEPAHSGPLIVWMRSARLQVGLDPAGLLPGWRRLQIVSASGAARFGLTRAALANGRVGVSEPLARELGVGVADVVWLRGPTGAVQHVVGGVFREYGNVRGSLVMGADGARAIGLDGDWTQALLGGAGAVDKPLDRAASWRRQVTEALAAVDVSYTVYDQAQVRQIAADVFRRTFAITDVVRALALLVAALGLLGTLMVWVLQRGEELGTLRAMGWRGGELAGLLLLQSSALGVLATLVAIPVGYLVGWLLVNELNPRAFGWTFPLYWQWSAAGEALLGALGAGVAAGLLPAAWLARRSPLSLLPASRVG